MGWADKGNWREAEVGKFPRCNYCGAEAHYDGKTSDHDGIWAYMCEECYAKHGTGLGMGKGQRLYTTGASGKNYGADETDEGEIYWDEIYWDGSGD